jgi:hypothetical protein
LGGVFDHSRYFRVGYVEVDASLDVLLHVELHTSIKRCIPESEKKYLIAVAVVAIF